MTALTVAGLAARVLAGPPRCGATRVVAVDGPSGAGKTTLATRLAAELGDPPVLSMDELYPGWDGLADAVGLLVEQVLAPLAAGRPAGYRRWDWERDAFGPAVVVGRPALLVVEGVGAGAAAAAGYLSLLVWIEAPAPLRYRRGMARDGEGYRPHWPRWAAQEAAHFASNATRERADLRLDGSARWTARGSAEGAADQGGELVQLP